MRLARIVVLLCEVGDNDEVAEEEDGYIVVVRIIKFSFESRFRRRRGGRGRSHDPDPDGPPPPPEFRTNPDIDEPQFRIDTVNTI